MSIYDEHSLWAFIMNTCMARMQVPAQGGDEGGGDDGVKGVKGVNGVRG